MESIVQFIIEIDKLKGVARKTKPLGLDRFENSAEHSWQIALLAASLAPYAPQTLDINRVILMLLVHDIGEIDTGDTIAFAEIDWQAAKIEELAAAQRIFALLPNAQGAEFLQLWQEFEDGITPESQFAHAADRAMPVLLNLANQGQSWRENAISYERVVKRIESSIKQGCPALWAHIETRLLEARDKNWFGA